MKRSYLYRLAVALAVLVAVSSAGAAWAAPKSVLWDRWLKHDAASKISLDHSSWEMFLSKYLVVSADGINRVRYGAVTPEDLGRLKNYIEFLSGTGVSGLDRPEQLAYWINLYNALTVRVILDYYPVKSIRDIDISPGWFSDGPWDKKLLTVEGEEVSLNDIEHRVLRPIWRDPRIHYAVNCASLGCPNLQARAFTAINAEKLLLKAAREYINHSRGATGAAGGLRVSSIYHWFKADFGGTDAGVKEHMRAFAEPELLRYLAPEIRITSHDYDWALNNAP